ncbi:MAG: hypothetical protein QXX99_00370 [Candidatus Bathyarchaeia archaeon]
MVAGVNQHVAEYAIIDKDLFDRVQRFRLRFKEGDWKRPSMSPDRRSAKVERFVQKVRETLREVGVLGLMGD